MKPTLLFVLFCLLAVSGNAQIRKQRLIAQSEFYASDYTGCCYTIKDSLAIKYSGARGSRFNWNEMEYISARSLLTHSEIFRQGSVIKPNNIDSALGSGFAQFDSMWYYRFDGFSGRQLERIEACEYYSDGSPFRAIYINPVINRAFQQEYVYFFGRLIRVNSFELQGNGARALTSERFITYDADGNAVFDSLKYAQAVGISASVSLFDYDRRGRYTTVSQGFRKEDSMSIEQPNVAKYEYTSAGNVGNRTFLNADSTGPAVRSYEINYDYIPGTPGYSAMTIFSLKSGVRADTLGQCTSHINGRGLKDTFVTQTIGDRFVRVKAIEYDMYGYPLTITEFIREEDSTIQHYAKTHFYYEFYDVPASVSQVELPTVVVFPNPVQRSITIRFDNGVPSDVLNMSITNVQGQLLQAEELKLNGNAAAVSLAENLVPGIYFIRVSGLDGRQWYRGPITKY